MTASIIATIAVAAILILFAVLGYMKGFLRIVLSTMVLVVTAVAAGILAPYLANLLQDTFVGKGINQNISTYMEEHVDKTIVNNVTEAQDMLIDKLPLPEFMRKDISEKNTVSEYVSLQVTTFTDYIQKRLATIIINVIAYMILLVALYLIFRLLLRVAKVVNKIPIIGGINRLFGILIGLAQGLLIIWCICLVIMMLSSTKYGIAAVEVINSNSFLSFLYNHNGILMAVNALFKGFLG